MTPAETEEAMAKAISKGHCPTCDYRGFILGPRGGAAINIECGNLDCRARFNVSYFAMWWHCEVIPNMWWHCEAIPKESEGGSKWGGR